MFKAPVINNLKRKNRKHSAGGSTRNYNEGWGVGGVVSRVIVNLQIWKIVTKFDKPGKLNYYFTKILQGLRVAQAAVTERRP